MTCASLQGCLPLPGPAPPLPPPTPRKEWPAANSACIVFLPMPAAHSLQQQAQAVAASCFHVQASPLQQTTAQHDAHHVQLSMLSCCQLLAIEGPQDSKDSTKTQFCCFVLVKKACIVRTDIASSGCISSARTACRDGQTESKQRHAALQSAADGLHEQAWHDLRSQCTAQAMTD